MARSGSDGESANFGEKEASGEEEEEEGDVEEEDEGEVVRLEHQVVVGLTEDDSRIATQSVGPPYHLHCRWLERSCLAETVHKPSQSSQGHEEHGSDANDVVPVEGESAVVGGEVRVGVDYARGHEHREGEGDRGDSSKGEEKGVHRGVPVPVAVEDK